MAGYALADAVENLLRGGDADVGADERILEFIEQVGVDFLLGADDVFDARDQARASLLNAALEFFKKSRLLGHRAEKGLDHSFLL